MNTLARDPTRPILMIAGLGYVTVLAAALIWLHLSPLIVLAMTVGGIVLAVCALRPLIAVHALIILMQFGGVVSQGGAGEVAAKGLGLIIVLGWLLNVATTRRRTIRLDGLLLAMVVFLTWCALLLFVAIDAGAASAKTMTFVQLAIAALMFSSVIDSPRKLRGIYWAIVGWTTLSAAFGCMQYLGGMTATASSLLRNRNLLALYVNIAIVCSYLLYQETRKPLARLALALSIPILFLALALTFSRSGLIVMGVSIIVLFARAAHERRFIIVILSSALICLLAILLPGAFWSRAGTIVPSIQRQEDTFGMRVSLWKIGMRMIVDHPLHGVGPGNFIVALPRYARGVMMHKRLGAHNSYVSVASEMGIVGLGLFLLLNVMALRRLHRTSAAALRAGDREIWSLAFAAELCILVIGLSGLSGHFETTKYLWIFFGLAIAIGRMPIGEGNSPLREPAARKESTDFSGVGRVILHRQLPSSSTE